MSTSPNNPPSSLWQLMAPHLGLIALSFALSRLTFELHELLTPYVAYTQGVDLLFLPAGVKLVLIMVAGWRGAEAKKSPLAPLRKGGEEGVKPRGLRTLAPANT